MLLERYSTRSLQPIMDVLCVVRKYIQYMVCALLVLNGPLLLRTLVGVRVLVCLNVGHILYVLYYVIT